MTWVGAHLQVPVPADPCPSKPRSILPCPQVPGGDSWSFTGMCGPSSSVFLSQLLCVPGPGLGALDALALILMPVQGKHQPHFIEGETEAQKGSATCQCRNLNPGV